MCAALGELAAHAAKQHLEPLEISKPATLFPGASHKAGIKEKRTAQTPSRRIGACSAIYMVGLLILRSCDPTKVGCVNPRCT